MFSFGKGGEKVGGSRFLHGAKANVAGEQLLASWDRYWGRSGFRGWVAGVLLIKSGEGRCARRLGGGDAMENFQSGLSSAGF